MEPTDSKTKNSSQASDVLSETSELELDDSHESELSAKQTKFLALIDPDSMLPPEWGSSDEPAISYFGIATENGILPFNQSGQCFIHNALADDSKENIQQLSLSWESVLREKFFEIESSKTQTQIDERQNMALNLVTKEKAKLDILKNSMVHEKNLKKPIIAQRDKYDSECHFISEKIKSIYLDKKNGKPYNSNELDRLVNDRRAIILEISQTNADLRIINNSMLDKEHAEFREFALRRGWYKDDSTFKYIDKRKDKFGITYKPEFAEKVEPDEYNQWLKKLFYVTKYKLFPEKAPSYEKKGRQSDIYRPSKAKNLFVDKYANYSVEELINEMTKKAGYDVSAEVEQLSREITEYLNVEDVYSAGESYWWNGHFATKIDENEKHRFICFNEIKRIEDFYAKARANQTTIDQQKALDMVNDCKNKLSQNFFGKETPQELFILPTGIVAFSGDNKLSKPIPITSESLSATAGIPDEIWEQSWQEYIHKYYDKDKLALAKNANSQIDQQAHFDQPGSIFNKHKVIYNDKLIDEETGNFLPNLSQNDIKSLATFLDKYDIFVGSIKYTSAEQRFQQNISDWRQTIQKSVLSTNMLTPKIISNAFCIGENGLTIDLGKTPGDIGNDLDALGLATQYAVWTNMSKGLKDEFFNILGPQLDVQQKLFVKTFNKFVYDSSTRQELVARAIFFDRFVKWQKDREGGWDPNKLDDAQKDFFDKLATEFKHK